MKMSWFKNIVMLLFKYLILLRMIIKNVLYETKITKIFMIVKNMIIKNTIQI